MGGSSGVHESALCVPERPVTFAWAFVKYCYMIDPSLLPALYAALVVAQTSSIGEAARRLHKTPSAVSQQLRRIEDHFGVTLFEKVGRRIRRSPAGEAALGALTRVFDEAASLGVLLGELAGARVTTL